MMYMILWMRKWTSIETKVKTKIKKLTLILLTYVLVL